MGAQLKTESKLHHNAHVTTDMEAVRKFLRGNHRLPARRNLGEQTDLFGKVRTYMHCFFDIGNGESLAFFQFADEDDAARSSDPSCRCPASATSR